MQGAHLDQRGSLDGNRRRFIENLPQHPKPDNSIRRLARLDPHGFRPTASL